MAKWTYLQDRNRLTDIGNRLVVAKREAEGTLTSNYEGMGSNLVISKYSEDPAFMGPVIRVVDMSWIWHCCHSSVCCHVTIQPPGKLRVLLSPLFRQAY